VAFTGYYRTTESSESESERALLPSVPALHTQGICFGAEASSAQIQQETIQIIIQKNLNITNMRIIRYSNSCKPSQFS